MNIRLNEVKAVNNSSVGSFLPYTNKKSTKTWWEKCWCVLNFIQQENKDFDAKIASF